MKKEIEGHLLEHCDICEEYLDDGPFIGDICYYCYKEIIEAFKPAILEKIKEARK